MSHYVEASSHRRFRVTTMVLRQFVPSVLSRCTWWAASWFYYNLASTGCQHVFITLASVFLCQFKCIWYLTRDANLIKQPIINPLAPYVFVYVMCVPVCLISKFVANIRISPFETKQGRETIRLLNWNWFIFVPCVRLRTVKLFEVSLVRYI